MLANDTKSLLLLWGNSLLQTTSLGGFQFRTQKQNHSSWKQCFIIVIIFIYSLLEVLKKTLFLQKVSSFNFVI
jgi:hypothetical protein